MANIEKFQFLAPLCQVSLTDIEKLYYTGGLGAKPSLVLSVHDEIPQWKNCGVEWQPYCLSPVPLQHSTSQTFVTLSTDHFALHWLIL